MPFCPECGTKNDEEARFCLKCGASLPSGSPASSTSPMSKHLPFGRIVIAAIIMIVAIALWISFSEEGDGLSSSSKTSVTGTYVSEHYPDNYLELHEDGTFHLKEMGVDATGEYEVEGNELKLYLKSLGSYGVEVPMQKVTTGKIEGNKIYDEDGEVWVKK